MNFRRAALAIGITSALLAVGCGVPQSKHDTTVAKLKRAERDLSQSRDDHNKSKQELTSSELRIKGIRSHLQTVQQQANAMKTRVADLEMKLKACKAPPAAPTAAAAPPPPPPGAGSARGGLDMAAVRAGIAKIIPRVKRCYEKRILKKGKKLAGTLIVKFRINKRGKPRRVKVRKGTIKHRKLQKCVRRAFRKARFPRSKKNTKVSYPLSFAP